MQRHLLADLDHVDGLIRRDRLLALGHSPGSLRTATRNGAVFVPRRGWLATHTANQNALRAVGLGGRLGASSALQSHGIWVETTDRLVVATAPTASRLAPLSTNELRLWTDDVFPSHDPRAWRVSVRDALLQHADLVDDLCLVASIDSALYLHLVTAAQLDAFFAALPRRLRRLRREVDGASMSGTETKMRVALVRAGFRVTTQVSIDRVGQVDLVVDGWLIVELDSRAHHDGQTSQHRDRLRDGHAILGGRDTVRFDYWLVRNDLDWCVSVVAARIAAGRGR